MASAAEYAAWLQANQDKKGTPDYETVAEALALEGVEDPSAMEVPQMAESGEVITPGVDVEEPDYSLMEKAKGVRETGSALLTGATTGTAGMLIGGIRQAAKEIREGQFGSQEAADRIEQEAMRLAEMFTDTPDTPAGQEYTQALGEIGGEYLAPMAGLAGQIPTGRAAAPAVQGAVAAVEEAAGPIAQPLRRAVKGAKEGYQERRNEIVREMREEPYSDTAAEYELFQGRPRLDPDAGEAIKQGWTKGEVAAVKAMSPKDKIVALQQIAIHEKGLTNERYRNLNRPIDKVGDLVVERIAYLDKTRERAGQRLESIARNKLKSADVDFAPAMLNFDQALEAIGATIDRTKAGKARVSLKGSDIQGDKRGKRILNAVLERLEDVGGKVDALQVHNAKRFIDTQVGWGKQTLGNPLTDQAARILKDLRADLNKALGDAFPEYRQTNQDYSETKRALDFMQDATNKWMSYKDPESVKAYGQEMRKILSNYQSRTRLLSALDMMEVTAAKHGYLKKDDVINQVMLANAIDRMFGSHAPGSLKGQIEQAMEKGVDAAKRRDVAELAIKAAQKAYEHTQGINEENAIKSMKTLLKRRN
jgi:enamine deaminase RidA (YjgF/YER057c/UK114 family)